MSKWTSFWDMNSGGGQKEDWPLIFIEAPREEAEVIFYNRFGHNPHRVTCTCCGPDYSIEEDASLKEATAWHRGCMTVEEYLSSGDALVIRAEEIKETERRGDLPEQGYVWV